MRNIQERSNEIHNNEYEIISEEINLKCLTIHKICGHKWLMNVNNHIYKKNGCPKCNKRLVLNISDVQERSNEIHNNGYKIIEIYIYKNKKYIRYIHKKCGFEFNILISNHLTLKQGCSKCYKKEKLSIQIIKDRIYNLYKDEYVLMGNKYINSTSKVTILHKVCNHKWDITTNNFLNKGRKCPNCYKNDKLTIKSIQEKSNKIHNNEYKILSKNYIDSNNRISIKHKKCNHKWEVYILNHLNKGTGCPKCSSSKGENSISNFLYENNIRYLSEYKFENCKSSYNNYPLRFDFYCPDYNLCIEYDGIQHYKVIDHFGGESKLEITKEYDTIKNNYCLNNNINIIRIPYTKFKYINKILFYIFINN